MNAHKSAKRAGPLFRKLANEVQDFGDILARPFHGERYLGVAGPEPSIGKRAHGIAKEIDRLSREFDRLYGEFVAVEEAKMMKVR